MIIWCLKAQYNPSMQQMSSPNAADNYMSYYQQSMSYPGFFDGSAWSTSNADALSYLGSYGQLGANDYMQQYSGFDYAPTMGFNWPYATDYSNWAPTSLPDTMKMEPDGQQHMTTMDQAYSNFYHMPDNSQHAMVNGQDHSPVAHATTPTSGDQPESDVQELEQGMQMISVNGNSDISQESVSETSVHEPTLANVNNSSVNPAPAPAGPPKPMSWAQLASQPAKPAPPQQPKILTKQPPKPAPETNSWDKGAPRTNSAPQGQRNVNAWSAPRSQRSGNGGSGDRPSHKQNGNSEAEADPTLSKLKQTNSYNPKSFDLTAKNARFFVIKSYSEDDIHRAIKYGVWCSTEHGNKRLDAAFKEREGKGPIYLLYSVNGSGHFCGMAQMMSGVDYQTHAGVWTQDKWKGQMEIKWIYVKDVPNGQLRHIRLENNENKPVTNSRDTQEVPPEKGRMVLKIVHQYRHTTSIFDDFGHYEKKEVEEGGDAVDKKKTSVKVTVST